MRDVTLAESLARARFSVQSPDRSIRVDASVAGGVDLHFLNDPKTKHTTASLERQLGLVLATAMRTREEVFRRVAERERAGAGVPAAAEWGNRAGNQGLARDIGLIEATGESRHRWVRVTWKGEEFTVAIDAVRYSRASTEALRWEVLSAVYDAMMDRREQYAAARRRHLGRVFSTRGEGRE